MGWFWIRWFVGCGESDVGEEGESSHGRQRQRLN
jgi:hypothetical protein